MPIKYTNTIVTIATLNLELLMEFYQQLIDEKPSNYIPNIYGEFQLKNLRLGIFKPKETNWQEFANSGSSPMSLCLEVENLQEAILHLKKMNYPPPGQIIQSSHGLEIYAYDPDNNRLILHQSCFTV